MIKIFHILAGKANPNTMNGVNKVVDAIATEQHLQGYDVSVVGIASNTEKKHNPVYKYQLYKGEGNFSYPKAALSYLIDNSDENSIFHFHSVFIPWFLPLIRSLKNNKRKHIFLTPHGQYVDAAMNTSLKKRLFFMLSDKKILNEVEAVHIIGCHTENNSYVKENSKRVVIIPNGFGNQIVPEQSFHPEFNIGYLGRLECKQKGLDNLIKGFSLYRKQGGSAKLQIAGSGPDVKKLKKIVCNEGMESFVDFTGGLYDEKKWNFIFKSAAMITPSRWEGLPTSCLESAAAGKPQLITEETNLGPYIKKYSAGLVIEQINPSSIAKTLHSFSEIYLDNSKYCSMCSNAKKMISDELNWKNITKRIITELYQYEER